MKSTRILVADDHSIVRRGVRALLESHAGWEVCGEAGSGREAVKMAKRLRPDVIVLDITLPELGGLRVTRQIRKLSPKTKILILSMHEAEPVVREALEAGARGYVFKSDLDRDLLTAVELLIQNRTFFTTKVSEMVIGGYLDQKRAAAGKAAPANGPLTPRQHEVLRLLAQGKTNKEVAQALRLSSKTVETHRSAIMRKLKMGSFSDLMRYAIRQKLVEL